MRLVDYLMNKPLYLGVRVEIAGRIAVKDLPKKYNTSHQDTQILDFHKDGKITVEKKESMIVARGTKNDKPYSNNMVNFSLMASVARESEIKRIVQIVNVLGNDRLIKEKISLFVSGKSLLNSIPEIDRLRGAFIDLDSIMPGFIKSGWYYAPEATFI